MQRMYQQLQQVCPASLLHLQVQAVSPDGRYFVTGGKKGALHMYQIPEECRGPVPSDGMSAQVYPPFRHSCTELHASVSLTRLQHVILAGHQCL